MATSERHGRIVGDASVWEAQWATAPTQWRTPCYHIDTEPASTVFLRNKYYTAGHRGGTEHDFTPTAAPPRFADELAWWVWL